jgi:hypothetical protein
MKMQLSYTQCKQLAANYSDLRGAIDELQSQPDWITQELDLADMQAIQQGGCASGAYMPAVTYHQALQTMEEHGDDVLQYIEDTLGELPQPDKGESWSGLAVFYLSYAVELWASQFDLDGVNWD